MSKTEEESNRVNWGAIILVGMICLTVMVVGIYGITVSYETLRQNTEKGSIEESPITAVLQAQLTQIGIFIGTVFGIAIGAYKAIKAYGSIKGKLDNVIEQTNGRNHTRDEEVKFLFSMVSNGTFNPRQGFDIEPLEELEKRREILAQIEELSKMKDERLGSTGPADTTYPV